MRSGWFVRWPALAGSLAVALWLATALLPVSAHAQTPAGMSLPAPGGTTWTVLQGYNTPSHARRDPYAIDLVRVDADGAGTPILAPLDGVSAYRSKDCLAIRDHDRHYTLLCHILPAAGVDLNDRVQRGDAIAMVKPPGPNEFWRAHVHIAVHRTLVRTSWADTIPFSGDYALEGRDLRATTENNAYAGLSFISSNGPRALAALTFPTGLTHLVWSDASAIPAEAFRPLLGSLEAVYAWSPITRSYTVYRPTAAAFLTTLDTLHTGDLLWFSMRSTRIWFPPGVAVAATAP